MVSLAEGETHVAEIGKDLDSEKREWKGEWGCRKKASITGFPSGTSLCEGNRKPRKTCHPGRSKTASVCSNNPTGYSVVSGLAPGSRLEADAMVQTRGDRGCDISLEPHCPQDRSFL